VVIITNISRAMLLYFIKAPIGRAHSFYKIEFLNKNLILRGATGS